MMRRPGRELVVHSEPIPPPPLIELPLQAAPGCARK